MRKGFCFFYVILGFSLIACSQKSTNTQAQPPNASPLDRINQIDFYLSKSDQSVLLQKQREAIFFETKQNQYPVIAVDSTVSYQTIDGFGYTLTSGSAMLISKMDSASKNSLLQELFGVGENSLGISYLRISIGASDLSSSVYSYNDLPQGKFDEALSAFSLANDTMDLIPVLHRILAINPNLKIVASPWSPPIWMKNNNNSIGGSLLPQYYNCYANYFIKYIQAMAAKGFAISAITIQNEPAHGGNNPSMLMTASEQAEFVKNFLGPSFKSAGISTKIIIWDHNCDNPMYPISILNDAQAAEFIDGSAFHLYAGDVGAMGLVHEAHPEKNLYFTEQWTGSKGSFEGDFKWHLKNVIIGTLRNWSKNALEWNLANDTNFGPHTFGGCTECKGALTINGNAVSRNVSYYIIGQASKYVPAGSKRIMSNLQAGLPSVAFIRPDGKKVLIVLNELNGVATFNIGFSNKQALVSLPIGGAGTFVW